MTKLLPIRSNIIQDGIQIQFNGQKYPILYPDGIWGKTPPKTQQALRDNLAMATTMHLPLVFGAQGATYDSGRPLLEPYFFQNFIKDLPSVGEADQTDTAELVRRFINLNYVFLDPQVTLPAPEPIDTQYKAILGTSFGKDSLLSLAVANEIGLETELVYIVEQSLTYEAKHKRALGEQFKQEFGRPLHILRHETGQLRDYNYLGLQMTDLGWGLQTTEYALEFIPFAYALNARYILFGNEQPTSAAYLDTTGKWIVNPAFDQSHEWTIQVDQITQMFTKRSTRTASLIEPLMDIMIQRILARRYPQFAKYQMSCFTDNQEGRNYRWCHNCLVCSKMYLLCVANGIDPQVIGLRTNMLQRKYKSHFVFAGNVFPEYERANVLYKEQLFAFLSAMKRGVKDELIEDFRNSPMYQQAKDHEEELYKTFCSLYDPISIPRELQDAVLSIYKEELAQLDF